VEAQNGKRASLPQQELTGWLLLFRVPIVFVSFAVAILSVKGPTTRAFFEATATIIPVLLLALAVEPRLFTPRTGPGAGDLIISFALLLVFGWGEAASLKAVANGHAPSGDGALVSATIVAGFVGIGLGALTANATPPTASLPSWLRNAMRRSRRR
jgi:hypothetical protein